MDMAHFDKADLAALMNVPLQFMQVFPGAKGQYQ
jgi:hypothetical protein